MLPENVGLYESTSAYQNLKDFGQLHGMDSATLRNNIERLLRLMNLSEKKDDPVSTFSKGMKQKVAIARTLVHDPILLFLDEPTANLDPEASKMVRDVILELKKEKRTIFLNTHNLDEAQRILRPRRNLADPARDRWFGRFTSGRVLKKADRRPTSAGLAGTRRSSQVEAGQAGRGVVRR